MLVRWLLLGLLIPFLGQAQQKKHVLLVSIDGLRPEVYKTDKWNAPFLKRLKEKGVYADGVISVFPTVTYPSHTAIVTGQNPGVHGIYYNALYPPKNGAWYWEASRIKVPTIWDAAHAAGLRSGAIMWPVTVGAPITYNFPVRRPKKDEKGGQLEVTTPVVTPVGLMDEMAGELGRFSAASFDHDHLDITTGRMASYIIRKYQPELMAVHFLGLDHAQHAGGRNGRQLPHSIALIDSMLQVVVESYRQAGLLATTDIIITGDHGVVSVKRQISPNALLRQQGLISDNGWKARFQSTGGSAFLYLKDPSDKAILDQVIRILKSVPAAQSRHFTIIERPELDQLGVNPEVALALAADNSSALNGDTKLPLIKPKKKITGAHGHDPRMPEVYTGFIGYGPSFKSHSSLERLHLTDISPLVSTLLGIPFNQPLTAELKAKILK
ncbi:ectonucleotide pyrophosphatase/phosphodiesterase [Niabella terrae]